MRIFGDLPIIVISKLIDRKHFMTPQLLRTLFPMSLTWRIARMTELALQPMVTAHNFWHACAKTAAAHLDNLQKGAK